MKVLDTDKTNHHVQQVVMDFHENRIRRIQELKLKQVLRRKNPYLFRAKNILTSERLVRSIFDAHISSNEETLFGKLLERFAIFVNGEVYGGRNSTTKGIDLEFDLDAKRYIVSIKSGPNWGNSSQLEKLASVFKTAKRTARTTDAQSNVVAVLGCCYGRDNNPDKGEYFRYCGQKFWEFISGDSELFVRIIKPLGHSAKERDEQFTKLYAQKVNLFTKEFTDGFCTGDGSIDWDKLVRFNSGAVNG